MIVAAVSLIAARLQFAQAAYKTQRLEIFETDLLEF
jgi:hypothetical protein